VSEGLSVDVATSPPAGLTGIDGYPHQWFGNFPATSIEAARSSRPVTFAASLAELVLTVQREGAKDENHALTVITEGAVTIIAGAEQSAVVVPAGPRRLDARSVHGELPPMVMALQNDLGLGPCLDAVASTAQFVVSDVYSETRWPFFTEQIIATGLRSMLCTPLAVQGKCYGSLSLVSTQPNAFDDESRSLAAVFAAHATLALFGVEQIRNLRAMADSRDLIGQAKGILMERHKLTADVAFHTLVRASQNNNVKLRDLCHQLTRTGELAAES